MSLAEWFKDEEIEPGCWLYQYSASVFRGGKYANDPWDFGRVLCDSLVIIEVDEGRLIPEPLRKTAKPEVGREHSLLYFNFVLSEFLNKQIKRMEEIVTIERLTEAWMTEPIFPDERPSRITFDEDEQIVLRAARNEWQHVDILYDRAFIYLVLRKAISKGVRGVSFVYRKGQFNIDVYAWGENGEVVDL